MSRTPHPGPTALLRADGMASALLVSLSWWSAILLAAPVSPTAMTTAAAVAVGLVLISHPPTRAALVARLAVLTRLSTVPRVPVTTACVPRSAPPPPRVTLRTLRTVPRTRAPGVVVAAV